MRALAAAMVCVVMASCGGGSDSGASSTPGTSGSSGGPVSNASMPAISLSTTSIVLQGDTNVDGIAPINVALTFNGNASPTFFEKLSAVGTAVAEVNPVSGGGLTGYNIQLQFYRPGQLGAGTYTDTVTVQICVDSNCIQQFPGSPATIRVTYAVTGSATPTTTYSMAPSESNVFAHTGDSTAPTFTANVLINDLPLAGAYVRWRKPSSGLISNVSFVQSGCSLNCSSPAWGTFTLTLTAPSQIAPGTYSDSLSFEFCFDAACTRPLPNSPTTVAVNYTVLLTLGKEFTSMNVTLPASDIAWNPVDQQLYATVPIGAARFANSIVQVNPTTGAIGASLTLSSSPSRLAISDDGQYAYVNLPDENLVQRVRLANLTADITIPMGLDASGKPLKAVRMAVAPGSPHTLAVALASSTDGAGAAVFDDAIPRARRIAPLDRESVNSVAWSDSATTLYLARNAYPPRLLNLDTVNVSGSGLTITNVNSTAFFNSGYTIYSEITYATGRLYETSGNVYDAVSGARLGTFGPNFLNRGSPTVLPDATLGKTFVMYTDDSRLGTVLTAFDNSTFQQLTGLAEVPNFVGLVPNTHLIRWGQRGLAAANGTNIVILSGAIVAP
jgi:hypothetical protein